jgi:tetratricopeptide (TPR) repeat protein
MPHDVFISYARDASRPHAEALHKALGADVAFFDTEEIGVGDPFPERLVDALYDARVIVIFAEPTYFTRRYCLQEFQIACGPFFQVLERQGATQKEKDEAIRGIIVALPPAGVDPMMERFPSGIGGRNWPKVDDIDALASLVRDEVAAKPPTLRERYAALGADEVERARFLASSRLPVPQKIGTIPVARSQPTPSIQDAFVGREDDLWRIHHVLANRGAGSATVAGLTGSLTAMGGMGKTRIALEYLWRFGTRDWRGGLFWINAEQVETAESQLYDVLRALNPSVPSIEAVRAMPGGVADALAAVIRAMDGPRPLFIIDNVPEAKPGERVEPLKTWCPALGEVPVLVTSRRQVSLGTDGSIVPIKVDVLSPDASVLMLTRDVDRHQLKAEEWKEIAQWVGHLPLALELLNGLLKSRETPAGKLLEMSRNERPSEALEHGIEAIRASVPVGDLRGIAEAFKESYDRLTPDQHYAARLIAWMAPEPVPEFMVEALGPDVFKPGVRSALSTRSFVTTVRDGSGAYFGSMHRVLADFVLSQSRDLDKEFDLLSSHLLGLLNAVKGRGDIGPRLVQDCFPLVSAVLEHRYSLLSTASDVEDAFTFANKAGIVLAQWGRAELARALFGNLSAQSARWLGEDHPNTLRSTDNLAITLRIRGDHAGAQVLQERVLQALRRILGDEHLATLDSMENLANTLRVRGDTAGAQELQERVLQARRRIMGEEHPETFASMSNLANTLHDRGKHAEAEELQAQVVDAMHRTLGEEHPDTLGSMNNLANALAHRGNYAGAQELQEQVLKARRRTLGEEHPDTLVSMSNLANTLLDRGDHAGAQELQERVLDARRCTLGEEHPATLTSMNNLAATLADRGDYTGAQQLHERVLAARRRVLGEEHPDTLISMNNLADTLGARGDHAGAQKLQEQAVEAMRRQLGLEHPWTTANAWGLLFSYLAQEDTAASDRVIRDNLLWLLERDTDSLTAQQRQIRAALEEMIELSPSEDEASDPGEP